MLVVRSDTVKQHAEVRQLIALANAGCIIHMRRDSADTCQQLVQDPEGWSRKMLEFIGLPWDPRCLDFHQTQRTVLTASGWQVRQKISQSSVARWRHYEPFIAPLLRLMEPAARG
jgi:hypothetical protein